MRALLAAAALLSCSTPGHLDRSRGFSGRPVQGVPVEQVPVKGHLVAVEYRSGDEMHVVRGELLAVGENDLWILARGLTIRVAKASIRKVEVELYESGAVAAGIWTAAGTASTLSHGFYLLITGPLWIATGVGATVAAAEANDLDVAPRNLAALYQYARFPQGLPPDWR